MGGKVICKIKKCNSNILAKGWCSKHYQRWYKNGHPEKIKEFHELKRPKICIIDGCKKKHNAKNYCTVHYAKLKEHGDPLYEKRKISLGWTDNQGYRHIFVNGKEILEHRYIMSKSIDRDLLKCETVHHINGIKSDNRIKNLELWSYSHPCGQRVDDKLKWAKEIIELYE